MNTKKWMFSAFVAVALLQLAVPAWRVFSGEKVLLGGREFKFRTAPMDPHDPFRGKYVQLTFSETRAEVPRGTHWRPGDEVFVLLTTDTAGFAKIESISRTAPEDNPDYVLARVSSAHDFEPTLTVDYPFSKYYMEESKAAGAETLVWSARRDTSRFTYASVYVKDGEGVLNDVLIDGVPLKELVGR